MSNDWVQDIADMHKKFGVNKWMMDLLESPNHGEMLGKYLEFRIKMLGEEYGELTDGYATRSPEDVVDAIIDFMVFAIGTLDVMGVDARKAWDKFMKPIWRKRLA